MVTEAPWTIGLAVPSKHNGNPRAVHLAASADALADVPAIEHGK